MEPDTFHPEQDRRLRSYELRCCVRSIQPNNRLRLKQQTDRFRNNSSTAFACVRASSLGLAVSDLSWVYCWAAIWGNIELGFGILGAVRHITLSLCRSQQPN